MQRLNTGWIKARWQMRHCDHDWMNGDSKGHKACRHCGTWRWFPLSPWVRA